MGRRGKRTVGQSREERADYMATALRFKVHVPGFHRELTVSSSARARGPN